MRWEARFQRFSALGCRSIRANGCHFLFCLQPIFHVMAVFTTTLFEKFVGTNANRFLRISYNVWSFV